MGDISAVCSHLISFGTNRTSVESRGKFAATGRSPGNENRRWHGTTRECLLGDNGNTTLCSSTSCSLCSIIRTSYSLNLFGKKTGWGRQVTGFLSLMVDNRKGWQIRCGHLHFLDLFEVQRLLEQCQAFEAEGDTSQQGCRWERV